jgi:hypothetical protein
MRTYLIKYKSRSFEEIIADWSLSYDGVIAFGVGEFAPYYWLSADLFDAVRDVTGFSEKEIDIIKRKLTKPIDVIVGDQKLPDRQLVRSGLGEE